MQIVNNIKEIRLCLQDWRSKGESVALVPTMGNLHAGHLCLIDKANQMADHVVASIFVNPLQFNDTADYSKYPRTLNADIEKLTALSVDMIFVPTETELYPEGRESITVVSEPVLSALLEGECRPGHFTGVTTVVCKLFNIVQPDIALFGEKDYQQLLIVRKMVTDLNLPIEIIAEATHREQDGLAMSSRNSRLNEQQRKSATSIFSVMTELRLKIISGTEDLSQLEDEGRENLDKLGFETEYVAIRSTVSLQPGHDKAELIILVAARLGTTRLIDNLRV